MEDLYLGIVTVFSWVNFTEEHKIRASLVAQLVKALPAMRETWVQSLGWENRLEKAKATHCRTLDWRIPQTMVAKSWT